MSVLFQAVFAVISAVALVAAVIQDDDRLALLGILALILSLLYRILVVLERRA